MVLTPEGRELARHTVAVLRSVDDLFRRLATEITSLVRGYRSGMLTWTDRMPLLRVIDRALDRAFGLVQRAALTSELFGLIVRSTDAVAESVFLRAIRRVETIVQHADPSLWQRVRLRLLRGGTGPDDRFARVYAALYGPPVERQRLVRSRLLDPNRMWVTGDGTPYRLSGRVWRQGRLVRRKIDDRIRQAIRTGEDAIALGRDLERFLLPEARGRTTITPRGGRGNSYARTLARTEIARVHGQATIEMAKVTPGVLGIKWNLSASHAGIIDECDDNASRSSAGLPRGVYLPTDVPRYPNHPNERCHLSHVLKSRSEVLDDIEATYGNEGMAAA